MVAVVARRVRSNWASCAALVAALACHASACATGQQIAGVGDIAFRLQWEGHADLDLSVVEPSGEKIWFGARRSATGGVLDVDCNFVTICPEPIENVFWAKGTAPAGVYHYQVGMANAHGVGFPIPFTVTVLHGRRAVTVERGEIRRFGDVWGPKEAVWRR
jgi:hypothetical protein